MTTSSTTTAPPSPAPWHRADELARKNVFKRVQRKQKHCYVYTSPCASTSTPQIHINRSLKICIDIHGGSFMFHFMYINMQVWIFIFAACRVFHFKQHLINIHSLFTFVHSCSSSPESSSSCSCTWASACACTQQHVHPHLHRFDYICTHWTFFTDYMLHAPCIMLLPLLDKQHVQLVHGLNTSRVSWNGVDDENGCSTPCPGTRGSKQPSINLQIVLHFS